MYNPLAMQYQVFVQNQADNNYLAAVIGMPECIAEGPTKEEAVANAKTALEDCLTRGEIVTIEVESPVKQSANHEDNPLLKHFGRFKDDPTFDDFLEKIAEYRRQLDEEEAAK